VEVLFTANYITFYADAILAFAVDTGLGFKLLYFFYVLNFFFVFIVAQLWNPIHTSDMSLGGLWKF
jgi:hypothetical protein